MDKERYAGMLPPHPPPHPACANGKPGSSTAQEGEGGGAKRAIISPTKAAEPWFGAVFDAWNSSSSGHQRAENRLGASTGWRDSRNVKLHSQFRGDAKRVSDAVGAGASDWDPQLKAVVTPELRARARSSVVDMLAKPGTMQRSLSSSSSSGAEAGKWSVEWDQGLDVQSKNVFPGQEEGPGRLFSGVVIYVNGSTHPQISDHKLKHILAEHGGRLSTHLGRRQVTHVILGRPAGGGGTLAGSKLQKEIQKARGAAVKFVGVEWILESIKAGKRLPETRFSNLKVASKGQQSVFGLYSRSTPPPPALATTATGSCIDGPGAVGPYSATSDTPGNEPPPSAQRDRL